MAAYKDYYQTLGVTRGAPQKDVRAAYRKLAAKHHPDRHKGDKAAEEKFKEIGEAYAVLNDDEKRKFYDQYGSDAARPGFDPRNFQGGGMPGGFGAQGGDFSDFFQTLFGGGFSGSPSSSTSFGTGQAAQRSPFGVQQPRALEAELEVDLLDAYAGATKIISLEGKRLEVTLPKGSRDGSRLRLRGQAPGGGDVLLTLKLASNKSFQLEGENVRVTVEVPDYVAVLGGPIRVPTLDGEVEMNLPERTRAGRSFRLRGQGWPRKDGSRGDQFAEVRVTTPPDPSEEQLELYRRLEALTNEPVEV